MPEIQYKNKTFDLTEEQLLTYIKHLANGWVLLIDSYYQYHLSGFSDITNIFEITNEGQKDIYRKYEELISDPVVLSSYNSIKNELEKIRSVDLDITISLAKFVNVEVEGTRFDKSKLLRRIRKIVAGKKGGDVVGPIWAWNPEYKEFVDKSSEILNSAQAFQKILTQRINELFPDSLYQ
jgi:hypothetical protein